RADEIAKEIEELPTVNIQYWIGSRKYYEKAIKIGKFYFQCGRKMTKSRGFVSIVEIEEITDMQKSEMVADLYYY
ncbi:MAG: hypothetical protein GY793_07200, partial [Proteobacteria bacterium]|nr:hypothetical protein [Pseudomonadota bacterium]